MELLKKEIKYFFQTNKLCIKYKKEIEFDKNIIIKENKNLLNKNNTIINFDENDLLKIKY